MLELKALETRNLQPLDLRLDRGACIAIQGPSGSGKSLLLRAIADLDIHSGSAWLDGRECSSIPAPLWRREVQYLAAEPGWWADRVADHFSSTAVDSDAFECLGMTPDCLSWPIRRLSTGERQRLALLRSLALDPKVLLLDEPTAALDPDMTLALERLIDRRREEGLAVLWVTHRDDQAGRVAERCLQVVGDRVVPA